MLPGVPPEQVNNAGTSSRLGAAVCLALPLPLFCRRCGEGCCPHRRRHSARGKVGRGRLWPGSLRSEGPAQPGSRARCQMQCSVQDDEPIREKHEHIWPEPQGPILGLAKFVEHIVPDFAVSVMEPITGHKASATGYAGFVEHARIVSSTFPLEEQRSFGSKILRQLVPAPLSWLIRTVFAVVKSISPEAHVALVRFGLGFAPPFAYWLVGENAVLGPEDEAREVHARAGGQSVELPSTPVLLIRKCKFMEKAGGCKGLCLNLCKVATEEYCSKDLGLPVYMDPNYKDFSCRMYFLQDAIPPAEDPAFSRPCAAAVGEPGGVSHCDERFKMPGKEPPKPPVTPTSLLQDVLRDRKRRRG